MRLLYQCQYAKCPHKTTTDEGFYPTYADQRNQDQIDARIRIEEGYKPQEEVDYRNILYQRQHLETIQVLVPGIHKYKTKPADRHIYEEVPVFHGGTKFCCAQCAEANANQNRINQDNQELTTTTIRQVTGPTKPTKIIPHGVSAFVCQHPQCGKTFYLHGTNLSQRQSQQRSVDKRIQLRQEYINAQPRQCQHQLSIDIRNIDMSDKFVLGTRFCSKKCVTNSKE